MSEPCTVLIAAPNLLPALKQRAADSPGELIAFADADALRALELITSRRPAVVALERLFAATPRGAALIKRIKADPSLGESEIRVVSHDSNYTRVSPRQSSGAIVGSAVATPAAAPGLPPAASDALPIDRSGTRRAPRFNMRAGTDVLVDGNTASLVDLSRVGAQVLSATVLRPNQRVRMTLSDDQGVVRCGATVSWAVFEIPPGGAPRYRAGLEFLDVDADGLDAYTLRHKS